jgi:hypothetical protein
MHHALCLRVALNTPRIQSEVLSVDLFPSAFELIGSALRGAFVNSEPLVEFPVTKVDVLFYYAKESGPTDPQVEALRTLAEQQLGGVVHVVQWLGPAQAGLSI